MSEIKARSAADYGLTMTVTAAERVKRLIAEEREPACLRVAVIGGG
jgi:Fe-S cluster assembly iron-binding protein IscA